ncbi:hypothetical protein K438DRAFT_1986455 [Mycena galopus ATCC 62051]|nr:hypothetical protein K438DRAFT_1989790 [Mycena galopus ATCC 62051]KAF8157669.1 hypothetical protein K438DRAFT_1986455 [Mycena galopus ATCC 62051]
MSTTLSPEATLCNAPISAIFDSNAATSYISLDWVINTGLRTQNSRASGVLTLPSSAGTIFASIKDVPVVPSLPSDLVLGVDWFQSLCGIVGTEVTVYLGSGALDLRQPLTPSPDASLTTVPSLRPMSGPLMLPGAMSMDASPTSSLPVSSAKPRMGQGLGITLSSRGLPAASGSALTISRGDIVSPSSISGGGFDVVTTPSSAPEGADVVANAFADPRFTVVPHTRETVASRSRDIPNNMNSELEHMHADDTDPFNFWTMNAPSPV